MIRMLVITCTLMGWAVPAALAHEGHGALGELHAHGDTLWGVAALVVAVVVGVVGVVLGKRK